MTILQSTSGLSTQQQAAVHAVESIYKEVCNQDRFSADDVKRFLRNIKEVHALCKDSFKTPMFSWQIERFSLQMYLENRHERIFQRGDKLTWTKERWKDTIAHELAILFYRKGPQLVYAFQLRLMSCWLILQYFKPTNFTGTHYKMVADMTFDIINDIDDQVRECIGEIRQWRHDNDDLIKELNSSRRKWKNKKKNYQRLVNSRMKAFEVELHHMLGVCLKGQPYEVNIKRIAKFLGLSLEAAKSRGKELGFTEDSFMYHMIWSFDKCKERYDKEYKWAEKVLSKTLTKKERKEFWSTFRIINPLSCFRTFTSDKPDLIPASNPLETSDDQDRRNNRYGEGLFGGIAAPPQEVVSRVVNPLLINPFLANTLLTNPPLFGGIHKTENPTSHTS